MEAAHLWLQTSSSGAEHRAQHAGARKSPGSRAPAWRGAHAEPKQCSRSPGRVAESCPSEAGLPPLPVRGTLGCSASQALHLQPAKDVGARESVPS